MRPSESSEYLMPDELIGHLVAPVRRFLHIQAASGGVLLLATLAALVLANSPWGPAFLGFWKMHVVIEVGTFHFDHPLYHLVNDGLMAIFFFVIGLEVKREIVVGELSELKRATLPVAAAIGGMIVPALVFLSLQWGEPGERGWGIPMATDIAFVVGCMAVLGSRVPHGLRVMLLSLAIADDIGAILVIAIGYTEHLSWAWLGAGAVGIAAVALLSRLGVRGFLMYTLIGTFIWFAFHESGVHATIAGVILGLMTPARPYLSKTIFSKVLDRAAQRLHGDWDDREHRGDDVRRFQLAARETISPLEYLEDLLHPWVSFAIMPIFALANAGVVLKFSELGSMMAIAIILGLLVGKPLGITLFSWLAIKSGLAQLPRGVNWGMLVGGGFLAGIGFTMALFIAGLALPEEMLPTAKIGILAGSLASATIGIVILLMTLPAAAERPTGKSK